MLLGALIGLIVGIIMIIYKKNQQKKALAKVNTHGILDQPDFSAYFHCASEETFHRKGLKFFDSNGALTLSGPNLSYVPEQRNQPGLSLDLNNVEVQIAPSKKRKMDWLEVNDSGKKYYLTSFTQNAFSVDKSKMDEFLTLVREIKVGL